MSENKKVAILTLMRPVPLEPLSLTIRALEDVKYDEIDAWLQSEYMAAVRRTMRSDPDMTEQEKLVETKLAQDTAASLSFLTGEGARHMATPKGLAKLIYEHCEKMPITLDELRLLLFDADNAEAVNKALIAVDLGDNTGLEEDAESQPKKRLTPKQLKRRVKKRVRAKAKKRARKQKS